MIRAIILWLFIRYYLGKNRDVSKMTPEQEFEKFQFRSAGDTTDIIRTLLTNQTLMYWEAQTSYERAIVKGGGMILKQMLDLHRRAAKIEADVRGKDAKIKHWLSFKNK